MRKGVEKTARVELFYREGKGKIGPLCTTHTSGAKKHCSSHSHTSGAKKHCSSHTLTRVVHPMVDPTRERGTAPLV